MSDFVSTQQPIPDEASLHDQPSRPADTALRRKRRRGTLLFTTAFALAAAGTAGMILHQPIEHRLEPLIQHRFEPLIQHLLHPHPATVAAAGTEIPAPVKPAKVMADNARKPGIATPAGEGHPAGMAVQAPNHAHPATRRHSPTGLIAPAPAPAASSGIDAILALKPVAVPAATDVIPSPAAHPGPAAGTVAGSVAKTGAPAAPAPVVAHAEPAPVTPKPALPANTLVAVPHPLAAARKLVAAPMTATQQVAVLSLVSQMGELVAELRDQNLTLSHEVSALKGELNSRLDAFGRRLNLEEAKSAIALATRPPATVHPAVHPEIFDPKPPAPAARVSPASYHVEAAATGIAILTHDDRSLQVSVGDVVPGVGRVLSITQYGAAWVVHTTHGDIR